MIKKLLLTLVLIPFFAMGQFVQNFDAGTTIPAGWTVINGGDTGTWIVVNFSGSATLTAHSGTNAAAIGYGSTAHNDFLVTPAVTVTAGISDFLTFWSRSRDPLYPEVISVKVSTTTPTAAAFTNVLAATIAPASGTDFYKYQFNLTAYVGQTIYIGFHSQTTDKFYFDLDDVEVTAIPSCLEPTAASASGATTQSVDISCTSPGSSFQVQYGPSGFTLGSGTITGTIAGTTTTLTGLPSSTSYQYYVRTDCGSSSYSTWVGPYSFATLCDTITSFPYTQGFDSATIPSCWSNQTVVGTANWNFVTANGNSTVTPRTGARMAEFRTATFNGDATKLVTPPLDLTSLTSPQVEFYYANAEWTGDVDELRVFYRTSLASPWVQIGANYTTAHPAWTQVVLPLPNPSATYYIAFEGTSNYARGINLDDVTISGVLGTSNFSNNTLKVYPNPTKDFLNIGYVDTIKSVEIFNMLGQKVLDKNVNANETKLDLTSLNSGNYLAKIQFMDTVKTVKVIKE